MASRRKARILAFQSLYFWEASSGNAGVEELLQFAWLEEKKLSVLDEGMVSFARSLTAGTVENIEEIDKIIKEHLDNWDISRLNRVDLAVLRISVYSFIYQKEISVSIIIDEAIGICKEFAADDSYKFVNGVLDSIRKTLARETEEK
jgi:N utilization substance protein B